MGEHRRLFGLLCAHEWDVAEQFEMIRARNSENVGTLFVLRCKHCGDIKRRDVRV